jgi:DNA-binding GntR family transcriptional regulator
VDFLTRNEHFHLAIAEMAGNQRLMDMLSRVLGELTRVFHLGLDLRDSTQEMREEHLSLSHALCARDTQAALQVVESQIARSQQRIMEVLLKGNNPGKAGDFEQILRIQNRNP